VLSPRVTRVLPLMVLGHTDREISEEALAERPHGGDASAYSAEAGAVESTGVDPIRTSHGLLET